MMVMCIMYQTISWLWPYIKDSYDSSAVITVMSVLLDATRPAKYNYMSNTIYVVCHNLFISTRSSRPT